MNKQLKDLEKERDIIGNQIDDLTKQLKRRQITEVEYNNQYDKLQHHLIGVKDEIIAIHRETGTTFDHI
nr:hypothetical protein [Mycobacterium sp. E3298]